MTPHTAVRVRTPPAPIEAAPSVGASLMAGYATLVRHALRRDRVRLALWVAGIVGLVVATASSVTGLYNTQAELDQYADLVEGNAALIVQAGPGYGLDDPTVGSVVMNELEIWVIIAVALMSIFLTIRHTRGEEESERIELVRAAPVGRHAPSAAALTHVAFVNVLVAAGSTGAVLAFGLPVAGSVAFGATIACAGVFFAALAAALAQVASSARTALTSSTAVLAVAFVLRAVGDVGSGSLSWSSPIGWGQAIRAFADERWWVLCLPIGAAALLMAATVMLQARRDIGAGLLAQREGPATASPRLSSPFALAIRLQRPAIVGWTVGLALFGFFYGIIAEQAETLFDDNPEMAEFFEQLGEVSPTDAFLSTSMLLLALIGSGFTISSVLRLRSEEAASHADFILATQTSRRRWIASHLLIAGAGTIGIIMAAGAATGLGFASVTGDLDHVVRLIGAGAAMAPPMLVVMAVTTALFGIANRAVSGAWAVLGFVVVVGIFAAVLDMPQWVRNISPFEHAPSLPGGSVDVAPLAALTTVAFVVTGLGVRAFERRDVGA